MTLLYVMALVVGIIVFGLAVSPSARFIISDIIKHPFAKRVYRLKNNGHGSLDVWFEGNDKFEHKEIS